jgi:hypothetical protein
MGATPLRLGAHVRLRLQPPSGLPTPQIRRNIVGPPSFLPVNISAKRMKTRYRTYLFS